MSRLARSAALGLALVAAAAPTAASARTVDLRSPDTRDAAAKAAYVDLRSPDARDVGRLITGAPATAAAGTGDAGTDWGELGLAGGGGLALVAVGFGAVTLTRRRAVLPR